METLQEYLNSKIELGKHNNEKFVGIKYIDKQKKRDGGKIDLSNCVDLKEFEVDGNYLNSPITELILGNNSKLTILDCPNNKLTSIDFLKQLPHPEIMIKLKLDNNNIKATDLEFSLLSKRFVNLNALNNLQSQIEILPTMKSKL